MNDLNFHSCEFVKSAVSKRDFIHDDRPQIILAGRSNAGKSSLINKLVGQKNMARTSSAPGKTAQVNYFLIDKKLWLVDLPGYGFAKVSGNELRRWSVLMNDYLGYGKIDGGVLIVDIRHLPTDADITMANWFIQSGVPFIVAANKCDKLSAAQAAASIVGIREELNIGEETPLIPISAKSGYGMKELVFHIIKLYKKDMV